MFFVVFLVCVWIVLAEGESEQRGRQTAQRSSSSWRRRLVRNNNKETKTVHDETVQNYCKHPIFSRVVTLSGMHRAITHPHFP